MYFVATLARLFCDVAHAGLLSMIIMLFTCRVELEGEIRLQVDELMREELKNLKLVGGIT